jgi:hypothetical protein
MTGLIKFDLEFIKRLSLYYVIGQASLVKKIIHANEYLNEDSKSIVENCPKHYIIWCIFFSLSSSLLNLYWLILLVCFCYLSLLRDNLWMFVLIVDLDIVKEIEINFSYLGLKP